MFRRATKVQFNAQKYALLTEKSNTPLPPPD